MSGISRDSPESWRERPVAVLVSGGLDSAILVGDLGRTSPRVHPIYVRFGLAWEEIERKYLESFLAALGGQNVAALKVLDMPIRPVYGNHWSTTGEAVPGHDTPDEAVFLPGRNLLLVVESALWCHLQNVPTLTLAPLASNPFPDARDVFFESLQQAVNLAVEGNVTIRRPYSHLSKRAVMCLGTGLPLQHTFSCIRPVDGIHCGMCNKCAERQAAFRDAELHDPTRYAAIPPVPPPARD
jgi:7-cyano-7-deazaguanine synthase